MPEVIQELTGLQNQKLTQVPPSAIRAFDNEISAVDGIIKLTLGNRTLPHPNTSRRLPSRASKTTILTTPLQPASRNCARQLLRC